jgi:hypothetical protein
MNNSHFKFLNKLLYNNYLAMMITIFLLITIFSVYSLLVYALSNTQRQSLVINSTMITKVVSSPTHFVASPISNTISYVVMPHSSNVSSPTHFVASPISNTISYVVMPHSPNSSSYSITPSALPLIEIPSFTTRNASLSISYHTLTGVWISNVVEQPIIKISKGTLSGNSLNVTHFSPAKSEIKIIKGNKIK